MLRIRLTRVGKKNSPAYRVVVADHKKAVKRKFIEILGHYNPASKPKELVIDKEKTLAWIAKGAQPSDTVNNLLCDLGILEKSAKTKKVYGKPTKKKEAGKETTEAPAKVEESKVEEIVAETVAPEITEEPAEVVEETVTKEAPVEESTAEPVTTETVETPEAEVVEPAVEEKK